MLKNKYNYILAFDFETTGLSCHNDRIIEIGAILLEKNESGNFHIIDELNVLIKQDLLLPEKIIEITGITDKLLQEEGISEEQALEKFRKLHRKDALLVAYNLSFDYSFLTTLYRRQLGIPDLYVKNDLLDVMAVYKDRHPYPHRLENAVLKYNVSVKSTHRALDDVKATLELLVRLTQEKNTILKYVNVIGYNPKYGPPKFRSPYVSYVPQYGNRLELEKR